MMRNEQIYTVSLNCPYCGKDFQKKIKITPPELKTIDIECLNCRHKWTYVGFLKSRIRCPKCGSSKNDVNRKTFGRFQPKS